MVTWINSKSGIPTLSEFNTTGGQGTPLIIDRATGIVYYCDGFNIFPIVGRMFQPEIFGAKADGTDDYPAFKLLKTAINLAGGGTIDLKPNAIYSINRYVGDGLGTLANDLMFDGLNFLKINGNGATISVFGNFNRAVTATQPLSGLKIRNSFRVTVKDLILNGNVQSMTKAGGVTEPSAEGLWIVGCNEVDLTSIESHHHAADGLYIGGYFNGISGKASRRVNVKSFNSHHNGRNALTIAEARGLTFRGCNFDDSGQSAGTYGQHSPCSSFDVEPSASTASPAPNTMDVDCGDITFYSCTFNGSNRNMLSMAHPDIVSNISFFNCRGTAPAGLSSTVNAVYFDVNKGLMENCVWDCGAQAFGITFTDDIVNTDVTVRNSIIKGTGDVIHCNHIAAVARVEKCRIISTATAPLALGGSKKFVLQLDCAALIFEDNDIFIPKEAYNREGAGDYHVIMETTLIPKRFSFNRFTTNLPANQSGSVTAHFANSFTGGNTTPIFDDKYTGTVPGAGDTYRPTLNDVFNTTTYYNRNH